NGQRLGIGADGGVGHHAFETASVGVLAQSRDEGQFVQSFLVEVVLHRFEAVPSLNQRFGASCEGGGSRFWFFVSWPKNRVQTAPNRPKRPTGSDLRPHASRSYGARQRPLRRNCSRANRLQVPGGNRFLWI